MNISDIFNKDFIRKTSKKVDEISCPYCRKRLEIWSGYHGGFIVAKKGAFEEIYNDTKGEDDEEF